MNLSPKWVAELQSRGVESIHWSGLGSASATDEELLGWCAGHGHVLFTHDLDFGAILAASKGRTPSVVQLRTEDERVVHEQEQVNVVGLGIPRHK